MDSQTLERELRTYRPAGLKELPAPFVWPRYEGLSVGNVPATIARLLGADLPGILPPLRPDLLGDLAEEVRRVILVILDGLGWEQFHWMMGRDPHLAFGELAARGKLLPLTTVFPSTTCNVLATLRTGASPVRHGLLAYEMYLREWQMGVECISFAPTGAHEAGQLLDWGMDPERFLPVPSLAELLAARGIPTDEVIASHLKHGALSRIYFRGVRRLYSHAYGSDFWSTLREVLQLHRGERFLLTGYWGAVDTLSHMHGPFHDTGFNEVRSNAFSLKATFLDTLEPEDRKGTLLLILADHGQIRAPEEKAIFLGDHPLLREALVFPPLGEARSPFFYVRAGHLEAVQEYLTSALADRLVVFSQEDAIRSGLFGPGEPYTEVYHRLGDLIGIMKDDGVLVRDREAPKILRGRHGGLMPQEMLVPLLAVRLDA